MVLLNKQSLGCCVSLPVHSLAQHVGTLAIVIVLISCALQTSVCMCFYTYFHSLSLDLPTLVFFLFPYLFLFFCLLPSSLFIVIVFLLFLFFFSFLRFFLIIFFSSSSHSVVRHCRKSQVPRGRQAGTPPPGPAHSDVLFTSPALETFLNTPVWGRKNSFLTRVGKRSVICTTYLNNR